MPGAITLKVYRGDELLRSEQFARDIIKIGRLASAHLCLEDERISRIHAVIEVAPDGIMSIIDMGSAEGTRVNGKRVNKGALAAGDEVGIGGLRILVEGGAPAPAPARRGEPAIDETTGAEPLPASAKAPLPEAPPPGAAAVAVPEPAPPAPEPPPEPAPARKPAERRQAGPRPAERKPGERKTTPEPERAAAAPVPARPVVRRFRAPEPEEEARKAVEPGVELRFFWGDALLEAGTFVQPGRPVLVGETRSCRFLLPASDLPAREFPVLRWQEGEYRFLFARGMTGEVEDRGRRTPLSQLVKERKATPEGSIDGAFSAPVPPSGTARVEFGSGIRVEARFRRPPRPAAVPWTQRINYQFLNLFLVLFFLQAGFIVAANNYPYDTDVVADDLFKNPSRMAKFIIKPPEQQPRANPYLEKLQRELKKAEPGEMAEKHRGTEGQMGKKEASKTTGRSAPRAIDPNAKEIVKNTGLVGLLGRGRSGGLSTIFGQGGLGGDLKGAIGNMFGPVVGDSQGLGGLGLKGSGGGGGGQGETIGIGGVGTKGRGGGLGSYGTGVGGLGRKSDRDVSIQTGQTTVLGSIDKELIRRVIQEHASQIRYCYEQGLQRNPKLEGKVTIRWVINADGRVSNTQVDPGSGATTLGDPAVHECMMSRIASWEFPKPKGGGVAVITYPWILRASGSGG